MCVQSYANSAASFCSLLRFWECFVELEIKDEFGVVFADHGDGNVTLRDNDGSLLRCRQLLAISLDYVSSYISMAVLRDTKSESLVIDASCIRSGLCGHAEVSPVDLDEQEPLDQKTRAVSDPIPVS